LFHDESSTLWFAAKEMKRDQPLSVYVGKNEKSKVIIKLQRSSAGPPPREGQLSEEQEKQRMLHLFRRNQELQVLCNVQLFFHSQSFFIWYEACCFYFYSKLCCAM